MPTTITVIPATPQLDAIAATIQLVAEVRDQHGQLMTGTSLSWTTSDRSIASVGRTSGLVTATANGVATITATAGDATGSANATVMQEITAVSVLPAVDTLVEGDTVRLTARATDGNEYPVANARFLWASSNTEVATVDTLGLVAGWSSGAATATATSSGVTGQTSLTVEVPAPTTIVVTPDTVGLSALGDTVRVIAEVRDQIGRPMTGITVTWATGDALVATVDSGGLVIARGDGVAMITASTEDVMGSALVNVVQLVTAVTVTPHADTIPPGDTLRLEADALDSNGHTVPGVIFTWSSTNSLAAAVDGLGLVYGLREGVAEIVATLGTVEAVAQISVLSPDRAALVALYDGTGGPNWKYSENWLSDRPIGDWSGVQTDEFGRVVVLRLLFYDLAGPIPPEIGTLSELQWLDLSINHLTGNIPPELGNLANLQYLSLNSNALTGPIPPDLGHLISLTSLNLSFNNLSGPIPPAIGNLANLETLRVVSNNGSNSLSGPIPPELGNLTNLTSLSLNGNSLSGPIPPELGNLTKLRTLDLGSNNDSNRLSGSIPPELGNLCALERLRLHRNDLSGPIPPELGSLTNLKSLGLGYNDLSGALPSELGNLVNLTHLWLHGNQLTGAIPTNLLSTNHAFVRFDDNNDLCAPGTTDFVEWMAAGTRLGPYCNESDVGVLSHLYATTNGPDWTRSEEWLASPALGEWYGVTADSLGRVLRLDLSNNGLMGHIPTDIGNLTQIGGLRIGSNPLYGQLPLSLTRLPLQELRYPDTELCLPTDASFHAWLRNVQSHEGTGMECEPLSDRDVLAELYNATRGAEWIDDGNWLSERPLSEWHGVGTDDSGRVNSLALFSNNLSGAIPLELGRLESLDSLLLDNNSLSGSIPASLGDLTGLQWLSLRGNDLSGQLPTELGNLTSLKWLDLSGNEISGPIPPAIGMLRDLENLSVAGNKLTGPLPRDLGNLGNLVGLQLDVNGLSGSLPAEFGNLRQMTHFGLSGNDLSGPLPPEIGQLLRLGYLGFQENRFSGTIPPELGNLSNLWHMDLGENDLTGTIPPELGNLSNLWHMDLGENDLTGTLSPGLGRLAALGVLFLGGNELEGPVPSEFSGLLNLRDMVLVNNPNLTGALPSSLLALTRLETLLAGNTRLCAPSQPGFRSWLANVPTRRVADCVASTAYLTQAVQSRQFPVPLVADEEALLRVFVTAQVATDKEIPAVRARFYREDQETYVADIPGKAIPIPSEVDESSLSRSSNAVIPATVVRPGLEVVIEVDPEGTLDPTLGVARRIPEEGRIGVEVRAMPLFDLTMVPFLYAQEPDSSIVDVIDAVAANPENHPLLSELRTLLPVGALDVTAHEAVLSSTESSRELLRQTEVIRVIERGVGHYMGMMAGRSSIIAGRAFAPGRSSFSNPDSSVVAHEVGHNMGLYHAPCGDPSFLDQSFPSRDGSLGAWGYDFERGRLIPSYHPDLMSYCNPAWISEYHFTKALRFRLEDEGNGRTIAATSRRSLLLWGGVDSDGKVFLDPAFVVDAGPALPNSPGDYALTGYTQEDSELFSISFAMPHVADSPNSASFVFALPILTNWHGRLASISLAGPGGLTTVDRDTDRPMAILRDPRTGRVRAILRDWAGEASNGALTVLATGLEVWRSRGIPGRPAWNPRP